MAVQLETLGRGLVAVKTGEGVFLSWRFLREEARGAGKERLTGADFLFCGTARRSPVSPTVPTIWTRAVRRRQNMPWQP